GSRAPLRRGGSRRHGRALGPLRTPALDPPAPHRPPVGSRTARPSSIVHARPRTAAVAGGVEHEPRSPTGMNDAVAEVGATEASRHRKVARDAAGMVCAGYRVSARASSALKS